jgi:hypothetical protein
MGMVGRIIQPSQADVELSPLLDYLSTITNPYRADQRPVLDALDAIIASDPDGVFRHLVVRATDQGPTDRDVSPTEVLSSVTIDVAGLTDDSQCMPDEISFELEDAESLIEDVVDFLQDDVGGLGFIYTWIRRRDAALSEE